MDKFNHLNNTTFENTDKVFADVEIGDAKHPDFYPQIKIKRWDNECNLSVRLIKDVASSSHKVEKDKIIWTASDNTEARFYTLPADGESEYGYNEFEVVLKEKPVSNVLDFSIQTKGLDFFYQPDETTTSGVIQPENVIGSYAVYHSTKKDHIVGQTNYGCGKAFHIYRPFAKDSNENKVWCGLNVDVKKELLTITIPQDFIDNAVYPIIVDPTFGNTNIGSNAVTRYPNNALFCKGSPGNGEVDKISVYAKQIFSSPDTKAVVWDYDDWTILTNGVGGTVSIDADYAWKDMVYSSKPQIYNTWDYYVGVVVNDSISVKYDSGASFTGGNDQNYNNYSSPISIRALSSNTYRFSIYATYTTNNNAVLKAKYNTGTDVGWTNESNAWDNGFETYASRDIPEESADDSANYLKGTAHDNSVSSGTITKVEIGVKGKSEFGTSQAKVVPVFNGSTDGSIYTTSIFDDSYDKADDLYWIDITSDGQAPGTWTWTDINNLDVKMYGYNTEFFDYILYIDQLYLKVTYTVAAGWVGTFNGIHSSNIAKINGIPIANIAKVNGVASS